MLGLLDDKKKIGGMIVSKMLDIPGEPHEESSAMQDYEVGLKAAAEKIVNAVHAKDMDSFMAGMKEFHTLYDASKENEEAAEGEVE